MFSKVAIAFALSISTAWAGQSLCGDVSIPTGPSCKAAAPYVAEQSRPASTSHHASNREKRAADDAYLKGARFFARRDFRSAEHSFESAVRLDPSNRTYFLALLYTREAEVNGLLHEALKDRLKGDTAAAEIKLVAAREINPTHPLIDQFSRELQSSASISARNDRLKAAFEGPIALAPIDGIKSFHMRGSIRAVVHDIYSTFGIEPVFDPSVEEDRPLRIDADDVDFVDAARVVGKAANLFAIPIDATTALLAADTKELRESLTPQVEETIYLSGQTRDQMMELANLVRALFDVSHVAVKTDGGPFVIRGPQGVVHRVHDLLMELYEEPIDVLLDINVYEVDKSKTRNIGFAPPTSASAIDVAGTAQKLISDNQTLLNQSISSGALKLSGSTYEQELQEIAFLVAAGVSGSNSFTSILGTLGSYDGVPLLGISMGSTSLNLLLNSTDARLLNALQIRSSSRQEVTFRVGSRYPILTAITKSSSSSDVASELAAAGVSSSTIAQLTGSGSSTTSTPQIQYEDIGLTFKVTPGVRQDEEVQLKLDLKLESLGGTGIEDIPILNHRALQSTVSVSAGQSTLLATLVSTNEAKALDGVPGLNDLPGFQGSNKDTDGTKNELLITVTPHLMSGDTMGATVLQLPGNSGARMNRLALEH